MRIKKVRCDQFAGLQDKEFDFDKGLNLIVGNNEAGKSTIVDLIYHLFFQNSIIDGRKDKPFTEMYFPKNTGAYQADTIDGVIRFETEAGNYKLSKEWSGKNGSCKLTLPDGSTIKNEDTINEILVKDVLTYGKGVFDELVFSSQKRENSILAGILGNTVSDNMEELSSTLTKAVMATGGVDIDKMEDALATTVASYEGHWDVTADAPEGGRRRGINNPWSKSVGSILSAYYKMETIADQQASAEQAEKALEALNAELLSKKEQYSKAKERRERFNKVRATISEENNLKQILDSSKEKHSKMAWALSKWPLHEKDLQNVQALKVELEQAHTNELYASIASLRQSQAEYQKEFDEIGDIQADDVKEARRLSNKIDSAKAKLKGLNLSATIKTFGANSAEVSSSISGDMLPDSSGQYTINEATKIAVPGVIEIQLAPKGIDINQIENDLQTYEKSLSELLDGYHVKNIDELQDNQSKASDLSSRISDLQRQIGSLLSGQNWESLEQSFNLLPKGLRSVKDLTEDVRNLCGDSIDSYIGQVSANIKHFVDDYGNITSLSSQVTELEAKIAELEKKLSSSAGIPSEFTGIEDLDQYDANLKAEVDSLETSVEEMGHRISGAEQNLGEKSAEEYAEEYLAAEREFNNQKVDYAHWKHIQDVFQSIKASTLTNPLDGIEKAFKENLSLISGGAICLSSMGDGLSSTITSGMHMLNSDILSEGTRDTISLAFRLAVLEHLYPNGGCVAIFDDPFTDMDPTRSAEACKLIEKFAEKNQVIFVTCDPKYCSMMSGNCVKM